MKDKPIAFYPRLARELGDIPSAIYYQQIYFWSDKGDREDGYIYKSKIEIEQETTLTREQQDRIRKKLEETGWIVTKLTHNKKGKPTLHFKCLVDIDVSISGKPTNGKVGNTLMDKRETHQYSITENTSENTTEVCDDEISYEEPEPETFNTKRKTFAKLGIPYKPRVQSDKQKAAWDTEKLGRYYQDQTRQVLGETLIFDPSKGGKHWKLAKKSVEDYGLEECKAIIDWYLLSDKGNRLGFDFGSIFTPHSVNAYKLRNRATVDENGVKKESPYPMNIEGFWIKNDDELAVAVVKGIVYETQRGSGKWLLTEKGREVII